MPKVAITIKIKKEERDYLDELWRKGEIASYAQSFRRLLYFWKTGHRTITRLRMENAVLRSKLHDAGG